MKTVRCLLCESEFSDEEIKGVTSCPKCGTRSIPCNIKNDIQVKINKHELHILLVWADNYANCADNQSENLDNPSYESLQKTIKVISRRLNEQIKEEKIMTLSEEIKELQNMGINATLYRNGKEDIDF